jgi:type II secretory pathway pseudopilin PulG
VDESPVPHFTVEQRDKSQSAGGCLSALKISIIVIFLLALLCATALGPIGGQPRRRENNCVQQLQAIGTALYSYANDNNGKYPDGRSSTAVFQKLVDEAYVTDLRIFYVPIRGKVEASAHQKTLKPENVCFDVTGGLLQGDSPQTPLTFLTGSRVTYTAGAPAVPVGTEFPVLGDPHSFLGLSWVSTDGDSFQPGIGVCFLDNSAHWLLAQGSFVPNFVPTGFDAHGKTYRQLTPDGVLR